MVDTTRLLLPAPAINYLAEIIKRTCDSALTSLAMRDQSNRATAGALLARAKLCRRAASISTTGDHRSDRILLDLAEQLEREAAELAPQGRAPRKVTIRTGKLAVHPNSRIAMVDGNPLHLTAKEYGILELLSLRKGTTVTKEMFLNHLYGGKNEPQLKVVDVFICKLRKKLSQATGGEQYIETVWGRGYVQRDPRRNRGGA
jgi:DNA-binding response OmpR family regulator